MHRVQWLCGNIGQIEVSRMIIVIAAAIDLESARRHWFTGVLSQCNAQIVVEDLPVPDYMIISGQPSTAT
jgi:hypothetical protein